MPRVINTKTEALKLKQVEELCDDTGFKGLMSDTSEKEAF